MPWPAWSPPGWEGAEAPTRGISRAGPPRGHARGAHAPTAPVLPEPLHRPPTATPPPGTQPGEQEAPAWSPGAPGSAQGPLTRRTGWRKLVARGGPWRGAGHGGGGGGWGRNSQPCTRSGASNSWQVGWPRGGRRSQERPRARNRRTSGTPGSPCRAAERSATLPDPHKRSPRGARGRSRSSPSAQVTEGPPTATQSASPGLSASEGGSAKATAQGEPAHAGPSPGAGGPPRLTP